MRVAIFKHKNFDSLLKKYCGKSAFNVDNVTSGYTLLHCAVIVRNIKAAQKLIAYGAQGDVQGEHGCTPLHFAVGSPELITLLVKAHTYINTIDDLGNTPLHWAALHDKKSAQCLLGHGAHYLKNYNGEYPALLWMTDDMQGQLKNKTVAALERQKIELAEAQKRQEEKVERERAEWLQQHVEDERVRAEYKKQNERLHAERKRKHDLAYIEHVEKVALENAPEIIERDYWTGDILILAKGSSFALWIQGQEVHKIVHDSDYASKSIFSPYAIHRTYCKKCPFEGSS